MKELKSAGVRLTKNKPDYVIVGETEEYDFLTIREASLLIQEGAKFIATNSDITGPSRRGPFQPAVRLSLPLKKLPALHRIFSVNRILQ